jgi:hypothetical protein
VGPRAQEISSFSMHLGVFRSALTLQFSGITVDALSVETLTVRSNITLS